MVVYSNVNRLEVESFHEVYQTSDEVYQVRRCRSLKLALRERGGFQRCTGPNNDFERAG